MAEEKKGFILYADQIDLFSQLPNEKAGELIKHIFSYVNDDHPTTDDLIINVAFTPIKKQLQRDLEKWDKTREGRSKAGKASAEAKKLKKQQESTNSTSVESVQQTSTNSTVSVNDNVTVNVNDNVTVIKKQKDANALTSIENVNQDKKELFDNWIQYRKEIKKSIKSETTLNSLIKKINSEPIDKCRIVIESSIENQWTGLFWDKVVAKRDNTLDVAASNAMEAAEIIRLRSLNK